MTGSPGLILDVAAGILLALLICGVFMIGAIASHADDLAAGAPFMLAAIIGAASLVAWRLFF